MIYARKIRDYLIKKLYFWLLIVEQQETAQTNKELLRKIKSCGEDVFFGGKITFSGAKNTCIGNNVHIGQNAFIRAEGGLTIGDNTHISRNLVLYTVNHQYEGKCLPYDNNSVKKPVIIGRNVWIGMNVCVAPGSKIGDGAIIGMGTTVSGEVSPMSIVGSQKWRTLGFRNEENYHKLDNSQAYGGVNGELYTRKCC